jgi:hypothetical protein
MGKSKIKLPKLVKKKSSKDVKEEQLIVETEPKTSTTVGKKFP